MAIEDYAARNQRPSIHFEKTLSLPGQSKRGLHDQDNVVGGVRGYNLYALVPRLRGNKCSALSGESGRIYVFLNMLSVNYYDSLTLLKSAKIAGSASQISVP